MKYINLVKDIESIRELFGLTKEDFSKRVGISRMNLSRYENGTVEPTRSSLEKIYDYPYSEKFFLNRAKELIFIDNKGENILLFHGSKYGLDEIKCDHLIGTKDFGEGFYLGETFISASTWICEYKESSVFAFYLTNFNSLKVITFSVDREWLYAILYYRNALKKFKLSEEVVKLINDINSSDIIIAPIADNQMYDTINRFAIGEISDEQCIHALSATNLGMQYVLKTKKAIDQLNLIDHMYLCEQEKRDCQSIKIDNSNAGRNKAQLSIREFARQGKFIYEIFEEI